MTWSLRDGTHEGGVGTVLIDGTVDWGGLGQPLTLETLDGSSAARSAEWHADFVAGWVPGCVCGWRGALLDVSATHRLAGWAVLGVPDWIEDEVLRPAWCGHVQLQWDLDDLARQVAEQGTAAHRLDQSICAARSRGASWSEIGEALGDSRQAAHKRWRHVDGA